MTDFSQKFIQSHQEYLRKKFEDATTVLHHLYQERDILDERREAAERRKKEAAQFILEIQEYRQVLAQEVHTYECILKENELGKDVTKLLIVDPLLQGLKEDSSEVEEVTPQSAPALQPTTTPQPVVAPDTQRYTEPKQDLLIAQRPRKRAVYPSSQEAWGWVEPILLEDESREWKNLELCEELFRRGKIQKVGKGEKKYISQKLLLWLKEEKLARTAPGSYTLASGQAESPSD